MLIPIGLDSARLARWPRVCTAIVVLCVAALAATTLSSGEEQASSAAVEAFDYLREHPYLAAPEAMAHWPSGGGRRPARPSGLSEGELAREQDHLDALAEAYVVARDATPEYHYSLVPARGVLQVGWITHIFMHAGILHLLGNLLIFILVVGPFLEDAWGSVFFAGFYLVGGVVAALVQLPGMRPDIPLLGASGAISACLGAFALRFAHRRVRMFYWLAIYLRGEFLVPAWLYACFGFAMDLLGLQLSGDGGGVAYGAHVGGFVFGVVVALVVRATGLEQRIAPEGAVQWRSSMAANRAAEALASGDVGGARLRLEELTRRPHDDEARLELARLETARLEDARATELLEPLLARRISAGDAAGARALTAEFRGRLRADRLRPATAYRLAELVEGEEATFALALYEVASAAGGALAAKALRKAAELAARSDPARAGELAARATEAGAADPTPLPSASRRTAPLGPPASRGGDPAPLSREEPVRVIPCRVVALHGASLELSTAEGRAARVDPARVAVVAAALIDRMLHAGQARRNGLVLDLVLRPRAGEPRLVLRIAGHDLNLGVHRPGVAAATAFAELVEALLLEGGASASPDPARAQGRPFSRFPDLATYEGACFGRPLTA